MPAPDQVLRLVDTFARHLKHYKSARYNETQVRREFLDPFFKALGWDMDNRAGYADAYKDVIHEDAIRIAGSTKAPDYCFRIGGTRKFFLEAKKPSVDVKGAVQPAYQLRRYAWSAKLPLSILSDFEEFAVYDTRVKPSPSDKSSIARTYYCTFEQYTEKWDEIAAIFSREAILQGSFDRYAESTKRKHGTAEVDDAFLAEIERWRDLLAKNFALRNPRLTVRDLNYAVQKTIDRIIFLRICEDRGTEDYGRLQSLYNGANTFNRLQELFLQADSRYNSGLFHFSHEKGKRTEPDTLTPTLKLDDKPIRDILRNLYYPDSPYEFSVLPADILGQVYERFLGKTISLTTTHKAQIQDKPEVRKAGGVYYTPTYIVQHIVQNTLGRLLNGPRPEKPRPIPVAQAADIKILDPACGSGSFLIVAYQYLLDWHLSRYVEKAKHHARGKSPRIYQSRGGEYRLTTDERKRILLNNIHGVDIDRQAVEVTKLSLLLKVLEGETDQVIQRDWLQERQRILPDLGNNIQCGNSLIGTDVYEQPDMLQADEDTQYRTNAYDWETGFPSIMKRGGFHCVIGNPPYDVLEKDRKKASWPHSILADYAEKSSRLAPARGGKLNLFRFFVVQSVQLTAPNGYVGMIMPLAILADISCARTRQSLLESLTLIEADCFPQKDNRKRRVFRDAKLSTVVLCGRRSQKPSSDGALITRVYPWNRFDDSPKTNSLQLAELRLIDSIHLPVPLTSKQDWDTLISLHKRRNVVRLGDVASVSITRGEINQTIYREFITDNPGHARLIKGVEIGRYVVHSALSQGTREWFNEAKFLKEYAPRDIVLKQRIALQRITGMDEDLRVVGQIIEPPAYFADSTNSVARNDGIEIKLEYILGILNSHLIQWCFKIFSSNNNVGTNELEILPFRGIDFENADDVAKHDRIVTLVKRITDLNSKLEKAKNPEYRTHILSLIATTDRKIDDEVFALYRMTPNEIERIKT